MTDKRQPPAAPERMPERLYVIDNKIEQSVWRYAYIKRNAPSDIEYVRVRPVDDARVEEIRVNRRDWHGGMGQITKDIDYLLSLLPRLPSSEPRLKDGGAVEDVVSRDAAMRVVCARCANPERYGPAQSIEGSERLWHFQIADGWNAGQCDAAAIIRLPRVAAPTESSADSIVQPGRGPRVCRECGHLKLNCKCVFPEPAGEEQDDTATLASYRQEYERLFNWRDLWSRLSNSRRFKLATQNERVEEKAARANRLIGKLIADYDATPAPPLAPPEPPISSERRCRECSHSWEHHRGGICAAYVAGRETEEGIEEIMCGCKCVFPAADAGQGEHQDLLRDLLRDAGAIVCVNDPDAGARVEIRFAELGDAQRLHRALAQSRIPVSAAADRTPTDLIAWKWAETLSEGERSVLLSSSLKRLEKMIVERCATTRGHAKGAR